MHFFVRNVYVIKSSGATGSHRGRSLWYPTNTTSHFSIWSCMNLFAVFVAPVAAELCGCTLLCALEISSQNTKVFADWKCGSEYSIVNIYCSSYLSRLAHVLPIALLSHTEFRKPMFYLPTPAQLFFSTLAVHPTSRPAGWHQTLRYTRLLI